MHFQSIPFSRLRILLLAVFMLFSTFGFYGDLMSGGHTPYPLVLVEMLASGFTAALWIIVLARMPLVFVLIPVGLTLSNAFTIPVLENWMMRTFRMHPVAGDFGIRFAATATMILILVSYILFVMFMRREGSETFKLQNELALAHGIQKTLVPPFALQTARFEIYGISKPSEKVGGDLVDAVALANGDAIAYLGDIAGHGLQAGILMGMLKTATRTALLDAGEREPNQTLPVLLERLNAVLPEVKEPHMYATFSAFRLCKDGAVYYALAASPPILHWHANGLALSKLEEEQFPLGLLEVKDFGGEHMQMERGDVVVVATDGVLEASDKRGEEFGVERLEQTIALHATSALPELAAKILEAVQTFGKQLDDQTILLIRRVA